MPFHSTNPFRSPNLIYRAVSPNDTPFFESINADTVGYVNSNASNIKLPTASDAAGFRNSVAEGQLLGAVVCLAPSSDNSNTPSKSEEKDLVAIGQVNLKGVAPGMTHHRHTEIGIDILPQYQGKGYGGETIRWALEYAFKRAGLHRVSVRAFGWNEGAIRLYERIGFKHEGRQREALWHEGRWWDGVDLSMLEGEWWELYASKGDEQER